MLRRRRKPFRIAWPGVLLLLIFALALFLRLHFLTVAGPRTLTHDELGYDTTAVQLLEKGVLGYNYGNPAVPTGAPNAFVTPGYPLFLAAVYKVHGLLAPGTSPLPSVQFVQAILSLGVVGLVFLLGSRLGGYPAGLIAACCAAIYPPFIWANCRILTEPLFTLFFTGYVYLVQVSRERHGQEPAPVRYGATGFLLGLSALIRPTVAPLLAVAPLGFPRGLRSRFFLATLCGFLLALLPWVVRNYADFHAFIPFATQTGNPFLRGTDPYDPYDRYGPSVIKDVPPEQQFRVGLERIRHGLETEPRRWVAWFTVGKLSWLWLKPWGGMPYMQEIANALHRLLVAGGVLGMVFALRHPPLRWPAAVVATMTAIQLAFIPLNRYVFPLMPALIVLAAWSATHAATLAFRGFGRVHGYFCGCRKRVDRRE